jgi:hypothetical protein
MSTRTLDRSTARLPMAVSGRATPRAGRLAPRTTPSVASAATVERGSLRRPSRLGASFHTRFHKLARPGESATENVAISTYDGSLVTFAGGLGDIVESGSERAGIAAVPAPSPISSDSLRPPNSSPVLLRGVISAHFDESEAIYRLEPVPDPLWLELFEAERTRAGADHIGIDERGRVRVRQPKPLDPRKGPDGYRMRGLNEPSPP